MTRGRRYTHSAVPIVPELLDTYIEANTERERAGEDGGHVNTYEVKSTMSNPLGSVLGLQSTHCYA